MQSNMGSRFVCRRQRRDLITEILLRVEGRRPDKRQPYQSRAPKEVTEGTQASLFHLDFIPNWQLPGGGSTLLSPTHSDQAGIERRRNEQESRILKRKATPIDERTRDILLRCTSASVRSASNPFNTHSANNFRRRYFPLHPSALYHFFIAATRPSVSSLHIPTDFFG